MEEIAYWSSVCLTSRERSISGAIMEVTTTTSEYVFRNDIVTKFTALIDHNHGDLGARDHAETQQNSIGPLYDTQCWGSNTKKLSQDGGNKQYRRQTERWNNGAGIDLHADMDKKERRQEFLEVGKPGISVYRLRIAAEGQTREQGADGKGKPEESCHRGNCKTGTKYGNCQRGRGVFPLAIEPREIGLQEMGKQVASDYKQYQLQKHHKHCHTNRWQQCRFVTL